MNYYSSQYLTAVLGEHTHTATRIRVECGNHTGVYLSTDTLWQAPSEKLPTIWFVNVEAIVQRFGDISKVAFISLSLPLYMCVRAHTRTEHLAHIYLYLGINHYF